MIAYYKTEVPFLRLVLFLIIGIYISISQNLLPKAVYELLFYALCSLAFLCAVFYQRLKLYLKRDFCGILIYSSMLMAGIVFANQHKQIHNANHFSKFKAQELVGVINDEPKVKGDIARFTVEVEGNIDSQIFKNTTGKLLIALRFDSTETLNLKYGDRIVFISKIKETEPPYNFSEFNYKRFLAFRNIYHQTFINKKQLAVIASDEGNPVIAFALEFRNKQVDKINRYLKDNNARGVASTLVLGYRETLDRDLLTTYSNTGTMHVLSVSGMHVAIVAILLNFLLGFMNKNTKLRIVKAILVISLVWFYALITGLAPSITRAAIMISFLLIAKARSKSVNIFNVLGLSAIIILLYNPFSLVDVGFQLSYIAVGGLIYLYPKVSAWYQPDNPIIKASWAIIAVSIAAQTVTAPFSLFNFHQFPVYFILSNLFIVLPATVIMYAGFTFLFFATAFPQLTIFATLLEKAIILTNGGLKLIENIPHANITKVWVDRNEIMLSYCLLIAIIYALKKVQFLRVALVILTLLVISTTWKQFHFIRQKHVTFFSLRKNTAVAFIKGRNAVLVTDLDRDEFTYIFSVKPYLDSCQVNNIKFVNPHLVAGEKTYTFENRTLKIIDGAGFSKAPTSQEWLLLSTNCKFDLSQVLAVNKPHALLIDGRNRDFVIKHIQTEATDLKTPIKTLKRYFSVAYHF